MALSLVFAAACGGKSDDDDSGGDDDAAVATPTPADETAAPTPEVTDFPATSTPRPHRTPRPTPFPDTPTPTPEPPTPAPEAPRGDLSAQVEVRFDTTGTPHIYASSDHDVFFAQGYVAAHQRFFQMELNRMEALGRKTEIYGSSKLADDMLARSLKPLDHAYSEIERWETDRPRELGWIEAYLEGVNAYIDDATAGRNGATFPDAILALDYVPEFFTLPQIFAMDYLFAITLGPDPLLELTITVLDLVLEGYTLQDVLRLQPIEHAYTVPDAEYPITSDEAASRLAGDQPAHSRYLDTLGPGVKNYLTTLLADPAVRQQLAESLPKIRQVTLFSRFAGSNAWVVHGQHTASGMPLLANDPHMGIDTPNTFHQVHLNTTEAGGDLDMMGVVVSGGPGLILGHTDRVGWGVTTSYFDVTDLYIEVPAQGPTAPPNGGVIFGREIVPFDSWDEFFRVRQSDGTFTDEVRTLKRVPHHGPVFPAELGIPEGLVISMKWAGEQPGSTMGTIFRFILAQDIDDIEAAMEDHRIGAGNFVFATVDGDIAYDPRTRLPEREIDSGAPPWIALPGTGGYEWTGEYIPAEEIPHTVNPASGIAVTANNDPSGDTADNDPLNDGTYLGATYSSGMRARRIEDWLRAEIGAGEAALTAADMMTLQADLDSLLARRLIPFLIDAASRRPDLLDANGELAMAYIENWDFRMAGDSVAACLFATWWPTTFQEIFQDDLIPELFDGFTGDEGQYFARPLVYFLEITADNIDAIDAGTAQFPSITGVNYFDDVDTLDVVETRDQQLLVALARSDSHLRTVLGEDMSAWRWDNIHTVTLNNAASPWVEGLDRGPYGLDGSSFTVDVADGTIFRDGQPPQVFDVGKAPVMREVMDFADGEIHTYNILAGGQVDDGESPHYNDQTGSWASNVSPALPFTRDEVEAATEETWMLPAGFPAVPAD